MPHPDSDRLRQAIERAVLRGPSAGPGGLSIRVAPLREQRRSPDRRWDPQTAGARWNPPKSFPTVYSSLDPHTALTKSWPISGTTGSRSSPRCPESSFRSGFDSPGYSTSLTGRHALLSASPSVGFWMSRGGMSRSRVAKRSPRPWAHRARDRLGSIPGHIGCKEGRREPHHLPRESLATEFAGDHQYGGLAKPRLGVMQICMQIF